MPSSITPSEMETPPKPKKRNTAISICKGIAIILMVVGHAEAPGLLSSFIYEFHMPLFFITAGYFFSLRYLTDESTFVKHRLRGLYVPFVKWALFFLIIHNLMFDLGILNEQYGNYTGGVTHPYNWHGILQNAMTIIFSMGGYDQFLAGAFWFFRALLVASILYLVVYKLAFAAFSFYRKRTHQPALSPLSDHRLALRLGIAACLGLFLLALLKTYYGLQIVTLVQRGDRDIIGCFFFAIGFLLKYGLDKLPRRWWLTLTYAGVVLLFAHCWPSGMLVKESMVKFLTLIPPALLGFLMVYNLSCWLDAHGGKVRQFLIYSGDNTLFIFVFHIIAFKVVSLIKIWYYGLDYLQIGCHMVIHVHSDEDLFWILYSIAGVGIPLGGIYIYRKLQSRFCKKSITR